MFLGSGVDGSSITSLSLLLSNLDALFGRLDIAYCIPSSWCQLFEEEIVLSGSSFRRSLWLMVDGCMRLVWQVMEELSVMMLDL